MDGTIEDWLFCYDGKNYFLYKVDDLKFPFFINKEVITISNSRFQERMVDLANRILQKWNLENIIKEYARHIKNQNINDFPKDFKRALKEVGILKKKDPYISFWYIIWKLFEEATKPKHRVFSKGKLGKILGKIYYIFHRPKFPYIHQNIENALELLFYNRYYNLKQKIALGFSLVFGLYRVYKLLEKKGVKIIYLP